MRYAGRQDPSALLAYGHAVQAYPRRQIGRRKGYVPFLRLLESGFGTEIDGKRHDDDEYTPFDARFDKVRAGDLVRYGLNYG